MNQKKTELTPFNWLFHGVGPRLMVHGVGSYDFLVHGVDFYGSCSRWFMVHGEGVYGLWFGVGVYG